MNGQGDFMRKLGYLFVFFGVLFFDCALGNQAWCAGAEVKDVVATLEQGFVEPFLTAPSPGIVAAAMRNEYYDSDDAYLAALGRALRVEYEAIAAAGFLLQLAGGLEAEEDGGDDQDGGDRLLQAGGVVRDHVQIAHDVIRPHPDRADVADVGARGADRRGEPAEHAGAVLVATAQGAEERVGHGPRAREDNDRRG